MSLSSQTVAEEPLAWVQPASNRQQKVPSSRQIVPIPDEKASPEPR